MGSKAGLKVIEVKVKPRAKVSELAQVADGTWVAKLKAAPVDGKANEELVALIAARFGCRKADVIIKAGASGRTKLIRIEGQDMQGSLDKSRESKTSKPGPRRSQQ
jgi:hypothetical protein